MQIVESVHVVVELHILIILSIDKLMDGFQLLLLLHSYLFSMCRLIQKDTVITA